MNSMLRYPLRADLPPLPRHMMGLPVDRRGFPVPYFVAQQDGEWKFDVVDPEKHLDCIQQDKCWICGERLGRYRAFVIGPMCLVNRISAEPPSHLDCAEFACQACPFMTKPLARRAQSKEEAEAGGLVLPGGEMLERNPGASAIWVTVREGYKYFVPRGSRGVLVQLDKDPIQLHAWARGKTLQWEALLESLNTGVPLLEEMCEGDRRQLEALDLAVSLARNTVDKFWVRKRV